MTWQDYFDACADNDIYKAFEALAAVGVLPVVNGEDDKGKIKRPIGSEGYMALKLGRRFYGTEIKEEYFRTALKNLTAASSIEESRNLLFA